jgi:hypothetical protein
LLFTLMILTKTTALFLLPAVGWALLMPLWHRRRLALRCALAAGMTFAVTFGLWLALIVRLGLFRDFQYYFFVNDYLRPPEFYWPLVALWWSFHGGLWVDHLLAPLALLVALGAAVCRRSAFGRSLLLDPVFGASLWAVGGCILFMTYQNHPQPRYFAVVAFYVFFVVAQGAERLVGQAASTMSGTGASVLHMLGWGAIALAALASTINGVWTLDYALHPEYTFVDAAERLTRYIGEHANGKRLLVSISGDEISLITHLPALCDDFGTLDLPAKLSVYQPGWYAAWNDIDPGTLEDIHTHYSLEQVAGFRAFDHPERNHLVLFKLHPLAGGLTRDPSEQNLKAPLPDDRFLIPVQ